MVFLEVPQQNKGILLNTGIHQSETNENLLAFLSGPVRVSLNLLEMLVLERREGRSGVQRNQKRPACLPQMW